jgi:hypothetical protein
MTGSGQHAKEALTVVNASWLAGDSVTHLSQVRTVVSLDSSSSP